MAYLTESDVHDYVNGICFKTGPPGRVGVETEWLVTDRHRPNLPVPLNRLSALVDEAGPPPNGSVVTFEPGGQLELSSPPLPGPASAYSALATDLAHIEKHLNDAGLRLDGRGLDPHRTPVRQLSLPRYAAMERYFDAGGGPSGRAMMCSTASLQICLDIGADRADVGRRWRLVHRLGPVLLAAFANSPLWRGRPTGWRSTRWAVWAAIDSSRTRPAAAEDPVTAWTRYALAARLMAVPRADGPWIVNPGLAFGAWLAGGHTPRLTPGDLEYHLSTLFPPVRPRGWLELRMIDAPAGPWWPVPLAVAAALVDDPAAAQAATAATDRLCGGTGPGRGLWLTAARDALTDPALAACARACFAAASEALAGMGAARLVPMVDAYRERFVEQGRCPADEELAYGGVR
ncbi:ergothioneine biosynthesis glutamate--cysteine ligase EgtA [Allosalinactinospora lopnorensis]|uniref:ergothioneine biosynthesis glutamate--cysteine ligase EgtA n=1 Tax=Allosalinactinospora lopnorensis TaxID=1352348 RepID=UPI000623E4EA|nr:ergothioneine biosynthesis glutamate--cysteine ligase EgtA [Allosalinactinospora lopnorensis]